MLDIYVVPGLSLRVAFHPDPKEEREEAGKKEEIEKSCNDDADGKWK